MQKGQIIIFYDEKSMNAFNVSYFNLKEPEPDMVEITLPEDEIRQFVKGMSEPICAFIEKGEELVKLDPTTMKRIARYNLEEENAALLKKIKKHKKAIAELEQKEDVLRDRFRKAIAAFKEIMENGYCDEDEDEYESEWE